MVTCSVSYRDSSGMWRALDLVLQLIQIFFMFCFCIPVATSVEFEKETGIEIMETACLLEAGSDHLFQTPVLQVLTARLQSVR